MSRHVPRRDRWVKAAPGRPAGSRADRLGPFGRPRDVTVEAERHLTSLRNRHGDRLRLVS